MNTNSIKRIVVVLGMHRSGTSALARGLKVLGVDLGDNFLPPRPDNEKGFWEDVDINTLNIDFLRAIGHDWHTLVPIMPCEIPESILDKFKLRAVEILRHKLSNTNCFGFKDPRLPRLLFFWNEVLEHLDVNINYIIVNRNPLSVAQSLAKRDGFELIKSYFLWFEHMHDSLLYTANYRRIIVDYDLLMENPEKQLKRIAINFSLEFLQESLELTEYMTKFIDDSLRHNMNKPEDLRLDRAFPPGIIELYQILTELALDSIQFDDPKVLSIIEFNDKIMKDQYPTLKYMQVLDNNYNEAIKKLNKREEYVTDLTLAVKERDCQNEKLKQEVDERELQISDLKKIVTERDGQISNLKQTANESDKQISSLTQAVDERDRHIQNLNKVLAMRERHIQELLRTISWRLTAPLRRTKIVWRRLSQFILRGGGIAKSTLKSFEIFKREGWQGIKQRLLTVNFSIYQPAIIVEDGKIVEGNDYKEWIRRYDTITDEIRVMMQKQVYRFKKMPLITVLMPVYNSNPEWLVEAIESVRKQIYPKWELCIADDGSTIKTMQDILERYAKEDSRIKVVFRERNGHISASSNSALEQAAGEYIALLDHDDLLAEHALYWVTDAINAQPIAKLIYSDEDKIDQNGRRYDPYFKSDWNPDLFLSHNMISHLGVYRADLVRKIGGFREGYEGSQDYDLALRCVEQVDRNEIVHIPRVLYHWRSHPGSTAQAGSEKDYALLAGARALNDHFGRIGISASAELLEFGMYRAHYNIPTPVPLVSLIIPTRNSLNLLKQCVDSILDKTTYENYEIIIVDNNSEDVKTLEYLAGLIKDKRIRVLRDERTFNFSALNNSAVQQANGEFIGLINNDIEVITHQWLDEMVSLASQTGVGAVGACLWYPNNTLQHGGCATGILGVAGHLHRHLPKGHFGYFGRAKLIQTLSVVTAACMVIRKSIYQGVGGLDEINLKVAFNDVDFCLRVREAGYRNIWTPYAELYHHESASRGLEDTAEKQLRFRDEVCFMQKRWGETLFYDPAYNPNLTLEREDFSLAWPPRVKCDMF